MDRTRRKIGERRLPKITVDHNPEGRKKEMECRICKCQTTEQMLEENEDEILFIN